LIRERLESASPAKLVGYFVVGLLLVGSIYLTVDVFVDNDANFVLQIILIGLAVGSIYAMAGLGLVLTYKATGVFNFAHGAIGVFVAYVNFQLNTEWGVPIGIAAPVSILVIAPLLGMLLERAVFRPLQRRGATTTEKLVATLGVFVLVLGIVITIWSGKSRVGPSVFSPRGFNLTDDLLLGYDQLGIMITLALVAGGLYVLFQHTSLGMQIRAVVDKPELAELASINANRISSLSWALGSALAALSGILFASGQLDPLRLTLFMLETLSVAVLARLTSLPLAVTYGVLVLGVGRALFGEWTIWEDPSGVIPESFENLKPNFSTLVLFAALLAYSRLDTVGEAAEQSSRLVARGHGRRSVGIAVFGGAALLAMPAFLSTNGFNSAHRFLAFAVIFASIVVISGFSGQITLGQAGFAGLGAFAAARGANELGLPVIVAMIFGGLMAMVGGFIAGWPALRRRGLFLALTTVAFGLFIYAFVLANSTFAGDSTGLDVNRPHFLWWDLGGRSAFYYYELVVVGLMLGLARNLRSGRLGRALAAMRDSEAGATSVGINLRRYKLFIFAISSFMAGVGGALLTQQAEVFSAIQFFPLESLFWFAVVVVAGISSITGAVLGAFIWVMLDVVIDQPGLSQLVIGAGALLLGRLPGGNFVGMIRVGYERLLDSGRRRLAQARAEATAPPPPSYVPSAAALDFLADPPPAPVRSNGAVAEGGDDELLAPFGEETPA